MSLLLDALKKAAEEKQRMGGDAQPPVRPRPQPAEGGGQSGSQLMNLLQGKDQGHELDNVEGFEPFDDEVEGKSGFSLSLIDEDDESLDKLGFKEQPLPEPEPEPEPNPLASFTLELLDEEELPVASETAPTSIATSEPSVTGLTLLDDDEPVPIEPVMTASLLKADETDAVSLSKASIEEEEQAASITPDSRVSSVPTVDETVTEPEVVVAVPSMSDAPAEASLEAVPSPDVAEALTDATPAPVVETAERPVQPQATSRAGVQNQGFEAAPDMVLDALQRRRRRQRVLVLSLLLSVGLVAGGWGYLLYEEQLQGNDRLLSRYQAEQDPQPTTPSIPIGGDAGATSVTGTESQTETGSTEATARVTPPVTTIGPDASITIKAVTETSVATAVETALEQDQIERKSGSVTVQGSPTSSALQSTRAGASVSNDDTGRVTVRRTQVTKGILEPDAKLGIERRHAEARVLSAYRAFRDGDLKVALKLYQQALAENPFSRDAVMGLAAIAATERDYEKSAYYYQQLLDYDPTDTSAFEGLIGLPDTGLDLVDMESRLRNYLSVNPDSVRGQARLGRVMARQKRWHEAQQAFFNAHRLDPGKAAYALNVAIALDHLRKYSVAKRYYEQAIRLGSSDGKESDINLSSARQRLAALSRLGN